MTMSQQALVTGASGLQIQGTLPQKQAVNPLIKSILLEETSQVSIVFVLSTVGKLKIRSMDQVAAIPPYGYIRFLLYIKGISTLRLKNARKRAIFWPLC